MLRFLLCMLLLPIVVGVWLFAAAVFMIAADSTSPQKDTQTRVQRLR